VVKPTSKTPPMKSHIHAMEHALAPVRALG
jgi:hypothetical protein